MMTPKRKGKKVQTWWRITRLVKEEVKVRAYTKEEARQFRDFGNIDLTTEIKDTVIKETVRRCEVKQ